MMLELEEWVCGEGDVGKGIGFMLASAKFAHAGKGVEMRYSRVEM